MSAENVERVRRGYENFARGGWEAVLDKFGPDIEWQTPDEDVQRDDPYHGIEGVRDFIRLWEEEMTDLEIEVEEIRDGGDCVLAFIRTTAKGRTSGVPIEIRDAHLWTHNGEGKVTSLRMFLDRDKARAAAGLTS